MKPTLHVCTHRRLGPVGSCAASGSEDLMAELRAEIARRDLGWRVVSSPCLAHCSEGPNLKAAPGGPMRHHCQPADAARIIDDLQAEWTP